MHCQVAQHGSDQPFVSAVYIHDFEPESVSQWQQDGITGLKQHVPVVQTEEFWMLLGYGHLTSVCAGKQDASKMFR